MDNVFLSGNGGWGKVAGRKGSYAISGWDIACCDEEGFVGPLTSFFITEFNNVWKAKYLFMEFKGLGDLKEVVISPRRDKRGRRFGFRVYIAIS